MFVCVYVCVCVCACVRMRVCVLRSTRDLTYIAVTKWVRRTEYKSRAKLFIFHFALMPLKKAWIFLYSFSALVSNWADLIFFSFEKTSGLGKKTSDFKTWENIF